METRVKVQRVCQRGKQSREESLLAGGSGKSSQRGHQTRGLKDRGDGRDVGRDGGREVPRAWKES